jgi:curved DNA-binding protein CbpA
MAVKDLYTILQVPPTATMVEIKKAYRKLALQYHPDKNPDNELAASRFLEIKKAYEVLGNTAKRRQYTYENWQQARNAPANYEPVTPQLILKKTKNLADHVATIDIFRMSHEVLYRQVKEILSEENLSALQQAGDNTINKEIVETTLKLLRPLPLLFVEKLEPILVETAFTDNEAIQIIHKFIQQKKKIAFWDKYNLLIILIATVLICTIIFYAGK